MRKETDPQDEMDQLWPALDEVNAALRMLWARGEEIEASVRTTMVNDRPIHEFCVLIERS